MQSLYKGLEFPQNGAYGCDQCNNGYSRLDCLRRHRQVRHEGVRYSCNQCDFQTKSQDRLKKHRKAKHEGASYNCNQCDLQTTHQNNVRSHIMFTDTKL